ncbi:unnamed protein product [Allacma fusca]|uniref:Uncharacterized protein n=1 Tax=Allacma fusca TaxID=39272 RepID=A0A8J2JGC0_9HEXA|nr:unnamed protein product [Allacma fusca]
MGLRKEAFVPEPKIVVIFRKFKFLSFISTTFENFVGSGKTKTDDITDDKDESVQLETELFHMKNHSQLTILNRKDLHYNFLLVNLLSKLCLIPVEIDSHSRIVQRQRIWWKRGVNNFYQTVWVLHLLHCFVKLTEFFWHNLHTNGFIDQLPCPILCVLASGTCLYVNYKVFWSGCQTTCLWAVNEVRNYIPEGQRKHGWSDISRQEVLLKAVIPIGVLVPPLFHLSLFLMSPDGFTFIYNYFSGETKGDCTISFFTSALIEYLLVLIWFSAGAYGQMIELMYFGFFDAYLRCGIYIIENGELAHTTIEERVYRGFRRLREVQIYIQTFNMTVKGPLAISKFFCLSASISLGFYGFKYFKSNWILALIFLSVFTIGVCLYPIVNERAFAIPGMITEYKRTICLVALKLPPHQRKVIVKSVHSVKSLGIKVGNFMELDRLSAPEFLHFVAMKIVDLLVGFGKY